MILLIGSNGQLGQEFKKLFNNNNIKYLAVDHNELDISNEKEIKSFFELNNKFDIIINCAAYNEVDKGEEESAMVIKINTYGALELAKYAKEINAIYVTYSTDFVFDGKKREPYTEEDIPNPLSEYGKSKANGEKLVLENYEKSYVIRTSWLFGIGGNNFNKQVINWSKTKDILKIADDLVSVPTYAKDLAYFSWKLIQTGRFGLYHITNSGVASKYEQAKYILEKIKWKGKIERAKADDFKSPAERPKYSKLSSEKVENLLGEKIPNWENGLDRFLKEMEFDID
ncbi:dTDP-4-dehydrorhamnose reductase [Fusobacterium pseudoperiodonticum]|uniref:dTDP-4-dehydrorhamnose reductase n=1 Tax=Fusobacterium pseudoperiodonticum TaxID=2663009 RepID=UPI0028EDE7CD|nr:dTDP-4-dehydrorhamnose reductase [Fusobacterium pseudoperiodonticum]